MIRTISLIWVVLLSACAGQVEQANYYLLRPATVPQSAELTPSQDYSLGSIVVAPYIDHAGLLMETSEGQVQPARLHLWAEPIGAAIRTYMAQEISRIYGRELLPGPKAAKVINIRIDQLHGTLQGEARLVAYWWIGNGPDISNANRFAGAQPLHTDGYGALANAEKRLLSELAAQIAGSLVPSTPQT